MGIHHSPYTHPIPIPMGIPIPTAALVNCLSRKPKYNERCAAVWVAYSIQLDQAIGLFVKVLR